MIKTEKSLFFVVFIMRYIPKDREMLQNNISYYANLAVKVP